MLLSAASASGGAVVAVGLDIYAVNNFSGPAAQVRKSLAQTQNEFRRTMYENLRVARNVYGGLAAAGAVLTRGMVTTYRRFAEFDYIMRGTQIVAAGTENQYRELRAEALRLGETTMFFSKDIANSMREMAKSGMPVPAIMNNIRASVAGAGATMESLDVTTKAIISTMAQFQVPHQYAMTVMDKLTAGALGSKSTVAQLSEALKYAAADFYALNIPMDTAIGMLMNVHNFGIEASMAGTSVGNSLRYMSKAMSEMRTSRQSKAFEMFGISHTDLMTAKGDFKDMTEIFNLLSNRMLTMTTIDRAVAMEALFGIRGKRGVFPQTAGIDMLGANISKVANSAGIAETNLKKMMATDQGNIQKLISSFQTLVIVIGDSLSPLFGALTVMIRGLNTVLTWATGGKSRNAWNFLFKVGFSMAAGFIILKTTIFAVKAATAGLMMMFSSNRISFSNMNKAMATGWAMMKASALSYSGVMDGIIARHVALRNLMVGKSTAGVFSLFHASMGSQAFMGIPFRKNVNDKVYTGRAFSDIATRKSYKAGGLLPPTLIAQHQAGGGLISQGPNAAAKVGMMGRLGMAGIMGKLGSFLMGPWGLAAMVGLPIAINLLSGHLRKNTDAIKSNTETQKKASTIHHRPKYDAEFFNESRIITNILKRMEIEEKLEQGKLDPGKKVEVVFNVDGKNSFKKTINHSQASEIFNMGL